MRAENYVETLKIPLPCGGQIWFSFVNEPVSVEVDRVNVTCFPKVFCPGTYSNRNGCPWFNRLWKFYSRLGCLDESSGKGLISVNVDESCIKEGNGSVGKVCDCNKWLIAFCGNKMLYDRKFRAKQIDEPYDLFNECKNVKTRHGGIIEFLKRIFGLKERGSEREMREEKGGNDALL